MLVEAMTEQGWSSVVQKLFKSHDLVRVHWNVEDEVSALQDGLTLLIVCAQFDNAAMMEWLRLTGGMFIDEKDHSGRTALHWAAYKVSGNVENTLLEGHISGPSKICPVAAVSWCFTHRT